METELVAVAWRRWSIEAAFESATGAVIPWSRWRRRHQYRVQRGHYRKRVGHDMRL